MRHAWRLPEGIDEVLPPDAWALEALRRRVLDLFNSWGYEYVMPALVEYLDSLLVGSGTDLELQTFRMVDQRSGRMLGVRADMTSQAARIDAAGFANGGTRRLCYSGTVVHANPAGVLESRIPLLAGAELFGVDGIEGDAEVVALMIAALSCAGIEDPVIELGHVGVFRGLAAGNRLGDEEHALFEALQQKSEADIEALTRRAGIKGAARALLCALPNLMGGDEVIDEARALAARLPKSIIDSLDEVAALAAAVRRRSSNVTLRFDLGELTGYGYHTGAVFTAFSGAFGRAVARGGRYDGVGRAFGAARAATGFDMDLKRLPRSVRDGGAIWVPVDGAVSGKRRASLDGRVASLRAAGETVICALIDNEAPPPRCDRVLVFKGDAWQVRPLSRNSRDGL